MTIADKLRRTDISAYLLFMWNIEDVVRVYNLDFDRIDAEYIAKFPEAERDATRDWMENIVKMMQLENVREHGHLQINKNVLIRLNDLHRELLKSPKFPEYGAEFYRRDRDVLQRPIWHHAAAYAGQGGERGHKSSRAANHQIHQHALKILHAQREEAYL